MSEGCRHPVRLPQYDSNETYYPGELSVDESSRTLHMRTNDGSSDIILMAPNSEGNSPVQIITWEEDD